MNRTSAMLLCVVATLLALGTVMVFSVLGSQATAKDAARQTDRLMDLDNSVAGESRAAQPLQGLGNGLRELTIRLIWTVMGIAALLFLRGFDYHWFEKHQKWIAIGTVVLLLVVLLPRVGTDRNGARRWIRFGPIGFQPSEVAKIGMLVTLAGVIARRRERMGEFKAGFLPAMGVVVAACGLVVVEPDLGTAALLGGVGTLMVMSAGAPFTPVIAAAGVGAAGLAYEIIHSPWRMERVLAFLDPWKQLDGAGYQLAQSLVTLGNGGIFGIGLGGSVQKLFVLPEASTDFILAVIGEELGLIGVIGVLFLFLLLLRVGLRIVDRARDDFGALLAFGITLLITLQAIIHTAVVTGSMPTKGIVLPFISSGGSSLVISLAAVGILLNISSQAREEPATAIAPAASAQIDRSDLAAAPGAGA